jgi:hypothetical protein
MRITRTQLDAMAADLQAVLIAASTAPDIVEAR